MPVRQIPVVVLDAMVYVRAALATGAKAAASASLKCLDLARQGAIKVVQSPYTAGEVQRKLHELSALPKYARTLTEEHLKAFNRLVQEATTLEWPRTDHAIRFDMKQDPKDAPYLNLAHQTRARYLISDDKHFHRAALSPTVKTMLSRLRITRPGAFIAKWEQTNGPIALKALKRREAAPKLDPKLDPKANRQASVPDKPQDSPRKKRVKVLVTDRVSAQVRHRLSAHYDVKTVSEMGWKGLNAEAIAKRVRQHGFQAVVTDRPAFAARIDRASQRRGKPYGFDLIRIPPNFDPGKHWPRLKELIDSAGVKNRRSLHAKVAMRNPTRIKGPKMEY